MGEASLLTQNFEIIAWMMKYIAMFMGICFVFVGLFEFKKYGEMRTQMSAQHSVAGPLMWLLAGAMLLILPKFLAGALLAVWGTDSPLSYSARPGDPLSSLIPPILIFIRIVGVGAFIRGIAMLAKSGGQHSQQGTVGKAVIHMITGILLVHIVGTMELVEQILGFSGF